MRDNLVLAEIVEPYAKAYMNLAQGNDLTDRFEEDVNALLGLLADSEDLRQFIDNPMLKPDLKKAALRQIFSDQVHPYTLNFLMLLVDRGRILFLEGICKQYQALLRQLRNAVLADVTAAVELNDDQKQQIRERVQALTGAQAVELETTVDPDLLGGVIIKVGSQVIDASLRGQLRRISTRLVNAT
jgi:F-type H+-transporting ATPase subunit delta